MEIEWNIYKSLNDYDTSLWDERVAKKKPFLSSQFLEVIEKTHTEDDFYYFIGKNNKTVVAIGFYYISKLDLLLKYSRNNSLINLRKFIPSFMKIKVGMTGTWETYGKHFWYDESKMSYDVFNSQFYKTVNKICKRHLIMVWRDYLISSRNNYSGQNKNLGFINANSVSFSKIILEEGTTENSYFSSIKKKHRTYMKKILRLREDQKLTIEFKKDYSDLIESTLYPLYANVNANAKEYQTSLIPKSFFINVKKVWKENTEVIIIKDVKNVIIAFVLLIKGENILNPFLMGMNHSKREFNLWYHCTWESIMYAVRNDITEIDLGATNFNMKQKLGAKKTENIVSLRFKNKFINPFLKRMLIHFA